MKANSWNYVDISGKVLIMTRRSPSFPPLSIRKHTRNLPFKEFSFGSAILEVRPFLLREGQEFGLTFDCALIEVRISEGAVSNSALNKHQTRYQLNT